MLLLLLHAVYSIQTLWSIEVKIIRVKPQEQPSVSCLIPNLLFIDSEPLAFALVVSKLNSIAYL